MQTWSFFLTNVLFKGLKLTVVQPCYYPRVPPTLSLWLLNIDDCSISLAWRLPTASVSEQIELFIYKAFLFQSFFITKYVTINHIHKNNANSHNLSPGRKTLLLVWSCCEWVSFWLYAKMNLDQWKWETGSASQKVSGLTSEVRRSPFRRSMCTTDTCFRCERVCMWAPPSCCPSVPPAPPPARGQQAGPQCPDVPLPAPEAADALPGEVSHVPGSGHAALLPLVWLLPGASRPISVKLKVLLPVNFAGTETSPRFRTREHRRMRRTMMAISQCMSVLDWPLWVG